MYKAFKDNDRNAKKAAEQIYAAITKDYEGNFRQFATYIIDCESFLYNSNVEISCDESNLAPYFDTLTQDTHPYQVIF